MSINLTKLTTDLNAHQNLPAQPSLSSNELKQAWDKPVNDIKTYLNNILTEEVEAQVDSEISSQVSSAVESAVEDIEGDLTALDTRLTGDETNIGNNASAITSLQGSVTSLGTRVSNLETGSGGTHTSSAASITNGTKDYEDTVKKNGQVWIFVNVKSSNVPSGGKTTIGSLASGYRPSTNIKRKVNCGSSTGGGNSWFSDLYINSNGTLQIDNQSGFVAEEYNFDTSFTTV